MSRLVFALLLLFPLLACNDPFRDQCTCTLVACFEGVSLRLTGNPDTTRYREFSVALAYGDTVEAASTDWGFIRPDGFTFTSVRLREQRPAHIGVRISYKQDGAPKRIDLDTSLAWKESVCNRCSGGSSCSDEMAYTAPLEVGLASRL